MKGAVSRSHKFSFRKYQTAMRYKLILLILIMVFSKTGKSQTTMITGKVQDSSEMAPVVLASVAILRQKDSVLQLYTRSNMQGEFVIPGLQSGSYILLVTFPKYVDYVDTFSIIAGGSKNFNVINLTGIAKLLDEVIIKRAPMVIHGDTTEYDASSYKVRENATVEELLIELPGIQVDKDGKIIAQGKQVQKVLVDGDEFFSDDPTVATKNLRADAISKVQVFDKKSDQAQFTGIDDGQEQKTINLKLKESAKNGYFGKASVGGLDKYYNATAMLNAFKAKRKFSVFGVASSTSQTGLSGEDQGSLGFGGGGGQYYFASGGGVSMSSGSYSSGGGMGAGSDYGQGLPESIKAGAHYSAKWNSSKNSAGGDYLYNNLNLRSGGNTFSQNTLLDSLYYGKNASSNHSSQVKHALNGNTDITLDSTSQLTVRLSGNTSTSDNYGENTSEALSGLFKTVNSSDRSTSNHQDNNSLNTSVFYRKRFKKKGRTISFNLSQNYDDSKENGLLNNISKFFDTNGTQISEELTDQNKVNTTKNQTWEGKLSYTNPLGKNSYIELNYSYNNNNSDQKRLSFNKDVNGKYSVLVDSLSSDFQYIYNTNSGGLNYRYNGNKISFNAGGNLSHTGFDQSEKSVITHRTYSYTNLFPRGSFRFKVRPSSSFSLDYNGRTSQPTIDQIQSLKNNADPLNIIVGNPDLKQSFTNEFSTSYSSFQIMNELYFFVSANYSTTSNEISSSYTIDTLGRRITQYINVNGNNSFSVYGQYGSKLGKSNWRLGISPGINISNTTNIINGSENQSKNFSLSPSVSLSKRDVEKYDFRINYNPSFNSSKSSISSVSNRKYWTQQVSLDGRYTFPWKIDLSSNVSFQYREKLDAGDINNQAILWNAYLEKHFLKKEQLVLRFSINDILDQNKGYSRVIQPYAIVEKNYLTFRRYGLITLTYNFNTTGTGSNKNNAGRGHQIFL